MGRTVPSDVGEVVGSSLRGSVFVEDLIDVMDFADSAIVVFAP